MPVSTRERAPTPERTRGAAPCGYDCCGVNNAMRAGGAVGGSLPQYEQGTVMQVRLHVDTRVYACSTSAVGNGTMLYGPAGPVGPQGAVPVVSVACVGSGLDGGAIGLTA